MWLMQDMYKCSFQIKGDTGQHLYHKQQEELEQHGGRTVSNCCPQRNIPLMTNKTQTFLTHN